MLAELRVGLRRFAFNSGAIFEGRGTQTGALAVQDANARFQEAVLQGRVWSIATSAAGVTIVAANVVSSNPVQPLVGIFNPLTSGVYFVIWRAVSIWNSGTPAAGGLVWTVVAPNSPVTAAGGNGALNNQNFQLGGSIARTFINTAMTGSGAGSILRYHGGPTVGALAANSNQTFIDQVDGDIIVSPGSLVGLCAAAAGTSPIVNADLTWEEVPI